MIPCFEFGFFVISQKIVINAPKMGVLECDVEIWRPSNDPGNGSVESDPNQYCPLLIHTNNPGKDSEVLKQYSGRASYYQIVRLLNS